MQLQHRFRKPEIDWLGTTWEVWLLREKQYGYDVTDVPRDSDGGYLRRGITSHKFMLNTWSFQSSNVVRHYYCFRSTPRNDIFYTKAYNCHIHLHFWLEVRRCSMKLTGWNTECTVRYLMENRDHHLSRFSMTLCCFPIAACFSIVSCSFFMLFWS